MGASARCEQEDIRCTLDGVSIYFFGLPVSACVFDVGSATWAGSFSLMTADNLLIGTAVLISGTCLQRTGCRKALANRRRLLF